MSMREQVSAAAKCREHVREEMVRRVKILIEEFDGLPNIKINSVGCGWYFHTNGTFESSQTTVPSNIQQCDDYAIKELVKVWPKILLLLHKKISEEFDEAWELAMQTNTTSPNINEPKIDDFLIRHSINSYHHKKISTARAYVTGALIGSVWASAAWLFIKHWNQQ